MSPHANPRAKLTTQDVALIRAWADEGPGRQLSRAQQARLLYFGVPDWWDNSDNVHIATIVAVLNRDSWSQVQPDRARLAQWQAQLDRARPRSILGL